MIIVITSVIYTYKITGTDWLADSLMSLALQTLKDIPLLVQVFLIREYKNSINFIFFLF